MQPELPESNPEVGPVFYNAKCSASMLKKFCRNPIMPPVASRQWSTGTLLDGIECLNQHNPAELLAAGDMSEAPPASREQAIQASLLSFEHICLCRSLVRTFRRSWRRSKLSKGLRARVWGVMFNPMRTRLSLPLPC